MLTTSSLEPIATVIVDCAFQVHRTLGPGLFESVYQRCLAHELVKRNVVVRCGISLPIIYDGITLDGGLQMDMLVAESIIIENKAVEQIHPVHHAQLLTYMKLSGHQLGFLINWNVPTIKQGLKRIVRGL